MTWVILFAVLIAVLVYSVASSGQVAAPDVVLTVLAFGALLMREREGLMRVFKRMKAGPTGFEFEGYSYGEEALRETEDRLREYVNERLQATSPKDAVERVVTRELVLVDAEGRLCGLFGTHEKLGTILSIMNAGRYPGLTCAANADAATVVATSARGGLRVGMGAAPDKASVVASSGRAKAWKWEAGATGKRVFSLLYNEGGAGRIGCASDVGMVVMDSEDEVVWASGRGALPKE